jgi:tRNA threonylcarbamoyladenosine biosynthesis protein TsaB
VTALRLAICSATRTASVALFDAEALVGERSAATDRHQAESLLPLIDAVLREAGVQASGIAGYALCIGPGSFTSLRIGLSTLKGLAFGTDVPVVPVSSLQALAAEAQSDAGRPLVAMLDAQRGEVYAAAFSDRAQEWAPREDILPERVYDAEELAERIPATSVLVGQGAAIVVEALQERLGDEIMIDPGGSQEPRAHAVGRLGVPRLLAGKGVDAAGLAPRYVRRAEAEVTRTAKRFEDSNPA